MGDLFAKPFKLSRGRLLPEPGGVALLGGEPPRTAELLGLLRQTAFLAAADAGAAAALAAGRAPDLLAGDFDSLDGTLLAACQMGGTEILRLPVHKDVTDGEFLLQRLQQEAAAKGWRRLLILGALGGRTDQTLANILCAIPLAKEGLELCFAGDAELLILTAADAEPRRLQLEGFAGCTASLLALEGAVSRVELAGFEYPLAGELPANISLGISNVILEQQAEICFSGGTLLVCLSVMA